MSGNSLPCLQSLLSECRVCTRYKISLDWFSPGPGLSLPQMPQLQMSGGMAHWRVSCSSSCRQIWNRSRWRRWSPYGPHLARRFRAPLWEMKGHSSGCWRIVELASLQVPLEWPSRGADQSRRSAAVSVAVQLSHNLSQLVSRE